MSKKLLAGNQLFQEVQLSKGIVDAYDPNILLVCRDVAKAEHKATLKEVGEWLEKKPWIVKKEIIVGLKGVTPHELGIFERGEMPMDKK